MKLEEIKAPAGVKDLYTLLHFLSNTELYEERLNGMEDMRERLNERINAVGDIKEIESIRAKAVAEAHQAEAHRKELADQLKQHADAVQAFEEQRHEHEREFAQLLQKAEKQGEQNQKLSEQLAADRKAFEQECRLAKEAIAETKKRADTMLQEIETKKRNLERHLAEV